MKLDKKYEIKSSNLKMESSPLIDTFDLVNDNIDFTIKYIRNGPYRVLTEYFIDYTTKHLSRPHLLMDVLDEDSLKEIRKEISQGLLGPKWRPNFAQTIYHIGSPEEYKKYSLGLQHWYTFNYMFNVLKKGIFVSIIDGRIRVFLPFSSTRYHNCFSELLEPEPGPNQAPSQDPEAIYNYELKHAKIRPNLDIIRDTSRWYANNYMFRNTCYNRKNAKSMYNLFDEGDKSVANFLELIANVCLEYKIPNVSFFINARDHPAVRSDGRMPYDALYAHRKVNPKIVDSSRLMPVFSQSVTDEYNDILIPNDDDIINCLNIITTDNIKPVGESPVETIFFNKKSMAVFRGSATGSGTTILNNKRIQIAFISKYNKLIDAGLISLNERLKKNAIGPYCHYIKPDQLIDPNVFNKLFKLGLSKEYTIKDLITDRRMSDNETSMYKYIIDIDGHTSAFRFGRMMRFCSVILKVDSPWSLWFSKQLIGLTIDDIKNGITNGHYVKIPVIKGSLSNGTRYEVIDIAQLVETIEFLNRNSDIAGIIANNSLNFYKKFINREYMLEYMKDILTDISKNVYEDSIQDSSRIPLKLSNGVLIDYKTVQNIRGLQKRYLTFKNDPIFENVQDYFDSIGGRLSNGSWSFKEYLTDYVLAIIDTNVETLS
jgi:hypothetical protein